MLQTWIINLAVTFIVRQIAKFGTAINWTSVKADLETRVRQLVPGDWFDSEAVAVAGCLVDAAAAVLADSARIDTVFRFASQQQWPEAITAFKNLIIANWYGGGMHNNKMVAALSHVKVA